jgi:hypothetical protein
MTSKKDSKNRKGSSRRADEFFARHGAFARDAAGERVSLDDLRRYDNYSHVHGVECDDHREHVEPTAEEIAAHEAAWQASFDARMAEGDVPF